MKDNVFINCPFDNEYFNLLKPLLFTILYLDLNPLISETSDSGEIRLTKIQNMMAKSKYSIHDLSRIESDNELPRFNMPFECGIDFGIKFSIPKLNKKVLILEKEKYRYQKVMSDISGNDIYTHNDNPELIIKSIRDWFRTKLENIAKHKIIWFAYQDFESKYNEILLSEGYDPYKIDSLTFSDLIDSIKEWILINKTSFKI